DGRDVLIAGQKSGTVSARDPQQKGALVWKTNLATKPVGPQGEIVWGGAVDGTNAYFGLNSGAVAALRLTDGAQQWLTPLEPAEPRHPGNSGAVSAIPGVVFSGGWDGVLHALSTETGKVVWEFNTVQEFKTVNGIVAKGGSMGGPGPTIAGGMVFVSSGYVGVQNGLPGNIMLAFSVE